MRSFLCDARKLAFVCMRLLAKAVSMDMAAAGDVVIVDMVVVPVVVTVAVGTAVVVVGVDPCVYASCVGAWCASCT